MRRWGLLAAGLCVALGISATFAWRRLDAAGPLPADRTIVVAPGTTAQLGAALTEVELVTSPLEFRLAAWATRTDAALRQGEFAFHAHASLRQILTILRTARRIQHRITIPEGLTAAQIARLLDRNELLDGDLVLPAEGAVLPQTYAFERGTHRAILLNRMTAAMDKQRDELWTNRAPNLPLSSPTDLITLASLVERETARPEERPHVAAVFLNRLRAGMRLQSDPTIVYVASFGLGSLDHPITRAELDAATPYNTYRIAGLPPGPIASPGLASLQAVAHPIMSDDLYFVADGAGGHSFARTLEDHNRNVARLRAAAAVKK